MPRTIYDWEAIQRYHDEGHGFVECQKRFGFCHTTWIKAIKKGRLCTTEVPFRDRRRKYDWAEIQRFYDSGMSLYACASIFGFCAAAWSKAVQRGEVKAGRRRGMPIEKLLTGKRNRTHVKSRLVKAGLLENRCSECGLDRWRDRELVMHIDHVNGVKNDNRLENLRMLCPNCHSQTETYSGRNMRRNRLQGSGPAL